MKLAFLLVCLLLHTIALIDLVASFALPPDRRAAFLAESRARLMLVAVAFFGIAVGRYIGYW